MSKDIIIIPKTYVREKSWVRKDDEGPANVKSRPMLGRYEKLKREAEDRREWLHRQGVAFCTFIKRPIPPRRNLVCFILINRVVP